MDNAASAKPCAAALRAMLQAQETLYANPSSPHPAGQRAAALREEARGQIAAALGVHPREVYFTSGGTEACAWALCAAARAAGGGHIVASGIEHAAVLNTARALRREGFGLTLLPADGGGTVGPGAVLDAMRPDTCLVCVMAANNETGAVQPLRELGQICKERGVRFFTDAVQAAGKMPAEDYVPYADMFSLSAHKFHGPKGAGVLCCKNGFLPPPLFYGGGQERGRRPGTENLPAVAGMAAALAEADAELRAGADGIGALARTLEAGLLEIGGCTVHAQSAPRLPGIVNVFFEGAGGARLLSLLYAEGLCVSGGAACSPQGAQPSHVLTAMGVPKQAASGSIRFSLGRFTTAAEVEQSIQITAGCVRRARA